MTTRVGDDDHALVAGVGDGSAIAGGSPLDIDLPCPDACSREPADVVGFDSQAAQLPCRKSAGIDVDAVGTKFNILDRVMPVHDDLFELLFALEKFVSDPEQVLVRLLRQGNAGSDASMNKEKVPAAV
jgi:hypothetical protein